jgi:hypothetical protein
VLPKNVFGSVRERSRLLDRDDVRMADAGSQPLRAAKAFPEARFDGKARGKNLESAKAVELLMRDHVHIRERTTRQDFDDLVPPVDELGDGEKRPSRSASEAEERRGARGPAARVAGNREGEAARQAHTAQSLQGRCHAPRENSR